MERDVRQPLMPLMDRKPIKEERIVQTAFCVFLDRDALHQIDRLFVFVIFSTKVKRLVIAFRFEN